MQELEGCADTLAGDDAQGIKGISGGERRRLSVAIGLVTDPQIILLDEPTSGLDSETAAQLIACLVRLAHANRTVRRAPEGGLAESSPLLRLYFHKL